MIFLLSLVCTCVLVFSSTLIGLLDVYRMVEIPRNKMIYQILPDEYSLDSLLYKVASYVVLGLTGFFIMPVLFLTYIQGLNFCKNRTTNERFSKKRPTRRQRMDEQKNERADSTGSSLLSTTTSMLAEDVI
jgi:hypothetical protein